MPKSSRNLRDVLVEEVQDLYNAETQLVAALPKVAKAAHDPKFKSAVESHLQQTKGHVVRLERVAELLGASPKGRVCQAMKGLVKETGERIKAGKPSAARDASLIGAAQKVEHYEIAGYGTVRSFAEFLNLADVAELLDVTLEEEAATDRKLTDLSASINADAESSNGRKEA